MVIRHAGSGCWPSHAPTVEKVLGERFVVEKNVAFLVVQKRNGQRVNEAVTM